MKRIVCLILCTTLMISGAGCFELALAPFAALGQVHGELTTSRGDWVGRRLVAARDLKVIELGKPTESVVEVRAGQWVTVTRVLVAVPLMGGAALQIEGWLDESEGRNVSKSTRKRVMVSNHVKPGLGGWGVLQRFGSEDEQDTLWEVIPREVQSVEQLAAWEQDLERSSEAELRMRLVDKDWAVCRRALTELSRRESVSKTTVEDVRRLRYTTEVNCLKSQADSVLGKWGVAGQ